MEAHAQVVPVVAQPRGEPAYALDTGDKLRIVVFGQEGLSNSYFVDAAGQVTIPLIGAVTARGLTTQALARAVAAKLRAGFIREPHVAIEVETYRPFFILGEVTQPGQYPYVPNMTVETAVAIAGGFTPRAYRYDVKIDRPTAGEHHAQPRRRAAAHAGASPATPSSSRNAGSRPLARPCLHSFSPFFGACWTMSFNASLGGAGFFGSSFSWRAEPSALALASAASTLSSAASTFSSAFFFSNAAHACSKACSLISSSRNDRSSRYSISSLTERPDSFAAASSFSSRAPRARNVRFLLRFLAALAAGSYSPSSDPPTSTLFCGRV